MAYRQDSVSTKCAVSSIYTTPKCTEWIILKFMVYFNICEYFITRYVLTGRNCQHLAQRPDWRTTPFRLSATAYSMYSQLPSILEAFPPSATWGRAMPWWQGLLVTSVDGRIILRWIFRKWDVGVWTGSSWLRIGTGDGHLWMQQRTFGFHKLRGISWLAENRLASQEGLCSME